MLSALALLTLLSVDRPPQATPPPAAPPWVHVMQLPAGAKLRITELGGRVVRGRLKAVSEHEIALEAGRQIISIARAAVRTVETFPSKNRRRSAKRGLLIGAAVGAVVGFTTTDPNSITWGLFLGAGWGGIGAAIGAIDGGENPAPTVVYHVDPNSRLLH